MGQNQSYHHPKSKKSNFGSSSFAKTLRFDTTERESIECVFDNLAVRSHGKGMNMHIFMSFFMSDTLVGERLFTIFDRDHDGYLSYYEFAHGLEILFKGTLKERANMTFALYDTTSSGVIKKVDCKMMLHYMPTRILNFAEKIISHKTIALKLLRKLESLDDGHLHGERLTSEAEKYVSELKAELDWNSSSPPRTFSKNKRGENNLPYRSDRSPSLKGNVDPTMTSPLMMTETLIRRKKRGVSGTMKRRRSKVSLSPVQLRRERSERVRMQREAKIEKICSAVFTSKHPYKINYLDFKKLMTENPVVVTALSSLLLLPAEMARETLLHSKLKNAGEAEDTDGFVCSLTALEIALMGDTKATEEDDSGSVRLGFYHHHQHQSTALLANNAPDLEGRVWKPVLGGWHERWCTLKGRVLWQYKSDHSKQPYKALFLEGCIIEPSCNRKRGLLHPKQLYGVHIEVVDDDEEESSSFENTDKHPSWEFFFEKESEQQIWLDVLSNAAHTVKFKDSYDIVKLLGQGRAGKVYMMRPKGEDEVIAVKVIEKKELGRIEQRMLRTEARILRFISHPNCVELYDVFEERERVYLVMEMLPMDFFDAISGKPRFTEEKWYGVCHSLASALVYLHDLGIVHRDMKPENILCNESLSVVKLTDFGLARILLPDMHLNLDAGTAAYKAPEVINSKGYGAEADIWGVGVIMYLVLAGRWPFDGPKQVEHILRKDPSFEGENWKSRSKECVKLVKQLLNKRPDRRPSAEDILNCDWMKKMRGGDDAEELEQFKLPPSTVMTRKTSSSYKSDDFNEDISIEAKRMSSLTITKMKESGISAKRESTMQRGKNDEVTVRRKSTSSPRTGKKSMTKKKKKKKFTFEEREEEENDGGGAGIEGYRRASRTFQTPPSSPLKEE